MSSWGIAAHSLSGCVQFIVISLFIALAQISPANASSISSSVETRTLEPWRQTELGLYLTARDAHRALTSDPSILFIDVRTTEEFGLIGHPVAIDRNIPFAHLGGNLSPEHGQYGFIRNEDFVSQVKDYIARQGGSQASEIILICRSGSRSRHSVNALADAGFTRVWHVVEGFEGTSDADGHRTVEGWRNANLPWTYRIRPEQAHRPWR